MKDEKDSSFILHPSSFRKKGVGVTFARPHFRMMGERLQAFSHAGGSAGSLRAKRRLGRPRPAGVPTGPRKGFFHKQVDGKWRCSEPRTGRVFERSKRIKQSGSISKGRRH